MKFLTPKRRVHERLIALVAASFLLINIFSTELFALAPQSGINNPATRCEYYIASLITSGRLLFADDADKARLLDLNNSANALLLSHGKILARKDLKSDPERLYRAIVHEQVEAVMQVLAKEDRARYSSLMNMVLSKDDIVTAYFGLFPAGRLPVLPDDLLLNDIVAQAFEILIPGSERLIDEGRLTDAESAFIKTIEPIIRDNIHSYFTDIFWDGAARQARIRVAMANGVRFTQATSQAAPVTEEAVEELTRQLLNPDVPSEVLQQAGSKLTYIKGQDSVLFQRGLARVGMDNLIHALPRVRCAAIDPVDLLIAKNYAYLENRPSRPITIPQLDETIDIFADVFNPALTNVTSIYLDHLKINKGERVLDLCSGSGIIGLYAALNGAGRVLNTDIGPQSIACSAHNARKLRLDHVVTTVQGDLFSGVPLGEKFDLVTCNLPLLEGDAAGPYQHSVKDPGFSLLKRFMNEVSHYLTPNGRVVVTCSDKTGPSGLSGYDRIVRIAKRKGFGIRELTRAMRHGETYYVFEFSATEKTNRTASVILGPAEDARLKSAMDRLLAEKEGGFEYEKGLLQDKWEFMKGMLQGKTVPPIYAEIDPTTECNLDCEYCYFRSMTNGKAQSLDRETLIRAVDELHFYGVNEIWFSGLGEPLMNAATVDAIKRAVGYKMRVGLYTNGVLLDDRAREAILDGNFIRVSIDTLREKTFAKMKRRRGDILTSKVVSNLRALIAAKKSKKSRLNINVGFMIRTENYDEMESFAAAMKRMGVDIVQFKLPTAVESGLSEEQIAKAYQRYKDIKARLTSRHFKVVMMETPELFKQGMRVRGTSFQEHATAVIRPDGNLYPQCYSELNSDWAFGDIRTMKLKDVWEGARHREVLNAIRPRDTRYNRYDVNIDGFLTWLRTEYKKGGKIFLRWVGENYVLPLGDEAAAKKAAKRRARQEKPQKRPEKIPVLSAKISRETWAKSRKDPIFRYVFRYDDASSSYVTADRKTINTAETGLPALTVQQREERLVELFNLIKSYYPNAPPAFKWIVTPDVIRELVPNVDYRVTQYDSTAREVLVDPYFFSLSHEEQAYLVYHELVTHIAKRIVISGEEEKAAVESAAIKETVLSLCPVLHPSARVLAASAQKRPVKVTIVDAGAPRAELCEPLGVEILAGALKKNFASDQVTVDLVDMQVEPDKDAAINRIVNSGADLVSISIKIGTFKNAEKLIRALRRLPEDKRPVIVAGNTISTFAGAELINQFREVIGCHGEGEDSICGIVRCLAEAAVPVKAASVDSLKLTLMHNDVPNLQFYMDGFVVPTRRVVVNMNNYSVPDRRMLSKMLELGAAVRLESSRGCPWGNCTFCVVSQRFASWRPIPVETVVSEIEYLVGQGVKQIGFTDEDFMGRDPRHAKAIAEEIIRRGLAGKFTFTFATRVRAIYDQRSTPLKNAEAIETLKLLKRAGLEMVFLGIESGSKSQLYRYFKGARVEENKKAVETLDNLGIKCEPGFIMFDQLMTMKELRENIEFLEVTGLDRTTSKVLGEMRPQEGSEFKAMLHRQGLLDDNSRSLDQLNYSARYRNTDVKRIRDLYMKWEAQERVITQDRSGVQQKKSVSDYLQGRIRGNITKEEKRIVTRYLTRLRFLDVKFLKALSRVGEAMKHDAMDKVVTQFVGQRAILVRQAVEALRGLNDMSESVAESLRSLGVLGAEFPDDNGGGDDTEGMVEAAPVDDETLRARMAVDSILTPAVIAALGKPAATFEDAKSGLAERLGAMPGGSLIYIAAPTAAGKTAVSGVITGMLGGRGVEFPVDAYLKPEGDMPTTDNGDTDYDHPDALYLDKARDDIRGLLDGHPVMLPDGYLDMWEHLKKYRGQPFSVKSDSVVIVDSVHALSDTLLEAAQRRPSLKVFLNAPSVMRLARTLERDKTERHTEYSFHINRWPDVIVQEAASVFPASSKADLIIDAYSAEEIKALPQKFAEMLAGELRSDPDPMEQAGILRSWVDAISRAVAVDIARARRTKPAPAVTAPADAAPIQRIEITVPAGTTNEETKFTKSLISLESSSSQEFGASSAGANSKTAALQKKEQSLILYADDILENAMVVDLEHAVRNILSKHNVLSGGRVVIYARVAANAMIVEKIMKRADASIETIKVTGDVLQANGDEVKEAEALVRLARARGSKEVLGLIRGATGRPEDLAAFARNAGLPIIVAGPEKGIYSFAGALALAIEAKMNNGLVRGWLIVLPPVRNLSDDLKRRYQEYRNSLIALAAA